MTVASPTLSPTIGTILDDRYELKELLGRGSGGRVYRARHCGTNHAVAVKILELDPDLGERARQRRKERFRREMTICGRLSHPDIVGLIDFGEIDDSLYLVFELVSGRTLAQILQSEGSLTVDRARRLMGSLLEILVYSHHQGVIHRDLKPSNLMILDAIGRPRLKVLDFGISALSATPSQGVPRLTLSNEMIGTPSYAAPEQLRGDLATAKSDLYAWGLILLECVTGKNVMASASLGEIFQRQLSPVPVAIPAQVRDHALGTVLRWVLEKDPARRAGAASEVLARFAALELDDLADRAGYFNAVATARPMTAAPLTETAPAALIEGERRQVTALCCRLVPRCAADHVDGLLLDAYRSDLFVLCRSTVEELGGTYVGGIADLALFYFGMPRAKDTDARMASRAALELSARIRARSATMMAQSQVGIVLKAGLHTGSVIAGERSASEAFLHGEVASIATALTHQGGDREDTSIMVSGEFRRLASRHGTFVEAVPLQLTWQRAALGTHQLVGESLSAVLTEDAAPMVGRDAELAQLVATWRGSAERGRVAVIRGEPGMGKSRLAYELGRRAHDEGHGQLTLRFSPELEHVALGALLELVRAELGFHPGQAPSCAGLAAVAADFELDQATAVPLLCSWMNAPLEAPFAMLSHSPQMQRAMLHTLVVTLVQRMLSRCAGHLVIEDLHWADPSTLDWIGHFFAAIEGAGGFVLATARPQFAWCWEAIEPVAFDLKSLSDAHSVEVIAGLSSRARLSDDVVQKIVERADGVPLFVEELARSLLDEVAQLPTGRELRAVPLTLRDLLTSRLDELGPSKESAQLAAAIGREFDFELLMASSNRDEAMLLSDLDQLVTSRLVLRRLHVERSGFLFRHALVRDAAYESLTVTGRRSVHQAIASALLTELPDRAVARPDLAALHLELAGRHFESQGYWLRAGDAALHATDYDASAAHLRRGLDVLARCPDSAMVDNAALDLLNGLGASLVAKFGYGHPSVAATFQRASDLQAKGTATPERAFMTQWGHYLREEIRPSTVHAIELAETLFAQSEAIEDRAFRVVAASALCRCFTVLPRHEDAVAWWSVCKHAFDREQHGRLAMRFGEPPLVTASTFAAISLLLAGRVTQALATVDEALALSRDLQDPSASAATLGQAAWIYTVLGSGEPQSTRYLELARATAAQAREVASKHGFPLWASYAVLTDGIARIMLGDPDAVETVQTGSDMWVAAGAGLGRSWHLAYRIEGLRRQGRYDEASEAVAAALEHARVGAEEFFAPEVLRYDARVKLAAGPQVASRAAAEHSLRRALAMARSHGARLFELRAALELHDLFAAEGRGEEIMPELVHATAWWHEHDEARDLESVRRALALTPDAPDLEDLAAAHTTVNRKATPGASRAPDMPSPPMDESAPKPA